MTDRWARVGQGLKEIKKFKKDGTGYIERIQYEKFDNRSMKNLKRGVGRYSKRNIFGKVIEKPRVLGHRLGDDLISRPDGEDGARKKIYIPLNCTCL